MTSQHLAVKTITNNLPAPARATAVRRQQPLYPKHPVATKPITRILSRMTPTTSAFLRVFYFLVCSSLTSILHAQAPGNAGASGRPRIIPPAPTTVGIGTYGSLPVDLNTGAVPVSVPLGEVRCRSLTLPLSLSYRSTGVRVEEVASWVGLGWAGR